LGLKEYIRNVSTAKGAQIQLGREKLEQKKKKSPPLVKQAAVPCQGPINNK
jgi:uncharacterized C2H2 Zn-finger protein